MLNDNHVSYRVTKSRYYNSSQTAVPRLIKLESAQDSISNIFLIIITSTSFESHKMHYAELLYYTWIVPSNWTCKYKLIRESHQIASLDSLFSWYILANYQINVWYIIRSILLINSYVLIRNPGEHHDKFPKTYTGN